MGIIYFQICCMFFIILLTFVYYGKKRLKNYENEIYEKIIISNFVSLILDILAYYSSVYYPTSALTVFICRLVLIGLGLWITLFTLYIYTVTVEKGTLKKAGRSIILIIFLFCVVLVSILPLNLVSEANHYYTIGSSTKFLFIFSIVCMVSWLVMLLISHEKVITKKYYPIYFFMLLGFLVMYIQYIFPWLLLIVPMETFITFLMYFTIENPDVKMIEQLNIAKNEAERANRAKSDFLSSMSHEIRTPLNAIVGLSNDLIDKKNMPPEADEDLHDIVSASETLLEIVGNILDINKIESDKMEIIEIPYNFKEEVETLARVDSTRIGDKPIKLSVHIAEDLPYELIGDKGHMKEIVNNLLTNAIKYTEQGTIDLNVKCINKDGVCLIFLSVQDTGRGIKAENISKLFTKFERLGVERNTTVEGTGLGLAITKKLVEKMGGTINVQSQYGMGSIFMVQVPQKIGSMTNNNIEMESLDIPGVNKVDIYTGKKILIVDDNRLNIKVAHRALEGFNFVLDDCMNGEECLQKARTTTYDIILMDIMMPYMSGETALKELKKDPNFKTPVIALTADAIQGSQEKYIAEGFADYIAKPFSKDQIKAKIDRLLKK